MFVGSPNGLSVAFSDGCLLSRLLVCNISGPCICVYFSVCVYLSSVLFSFNYVHVQCILSVNHFHVQCTFVGPDTWAGRCRGIFWPDEYTTLLNIASMFA